MIAPERTIREDREDPDDQHREYCEEDDHRRVECRWRATRHPGKLHLERNEKYQSEDPDPEQISKELSKRPLVPPRLRMPLDARSDADGRGAASNVVSTGIRLGGSHLVESCPPSIRTLAVFDSFDSGQACRPDCPTTNVRFVTTVPRSARTTFQLCAKTR